MSAAPPAHKLLIGNRRYSSWSLRGWLAVRLAGLDFEERLIPLAGGVTEAVREASPSGRVPALFVATPAGGYWVCESLAIVEYCAEQQPALWPADREARAVARAISAEMHAGFAALRSHLPMNLARTLLPRGQGLPPPVLADIARIASIWAETRATYGGDGPYLFGERFGAADAMFAPVVTRFASYDAWPDGESRDYCTAVLAHPLMREWVGGAIHEPWTVPGTDELD